MAEQAPQQQATDRTPEQILELMITAAGTADVVRLAALISDYTAEVPDLTFTRPILTDLWSQRWRRHLRDHGSRRPEARVNRSMPTLIGVEAVTGADTPQMSVGRVELVAFLAARVYMADALDLQNPHSNTLPVGEATRQEIAALLNPIPPEIPETPSDPSDPPPGQP